MVDKLSSAIPIKMPQVNVNDDFVTLVGWHVEDGGEVREGEPLCEVETSKAVGDVPTPASGFIRQLTQPGDVINIGDVFARIGPTIDALDDHVAEQSAPPVEAKPAYQKSTAAGAASDPPGKVHASAGAQALALQYGLDLGEVRHDGDRIRREDVERHLDAHGRKDLAPEPLDELARPQLPAGLRELVDSRGPMNDHTWAIARHLEQTQARVLPAHVMMDVSAVGALAWTSAQQAKGLMTSILPVLIHAVGRAAASHEELLNFRLGRDLYRYRGVDVAYTGRDTQGRLYTPVVRGAEERELDEIATECNRLNMAMIRRQLRPEEMSGACATVSMLSEQPVRSHIGLQNAYQSVLITAGAVREELRLEEGRPVAVPTLTIAMTYDHGLMDGWQSAQALTTVKSHFEAPEA